MKNVYKYAWTLLYILLLGIALYSGFQLFSELRIRQQAKNTFSQLTQLAYSTQPSAVTQPATAQPSQQWSEPSDSPVLDSDFLPVSVPQPAEIQLDVLAAINPDCIGWICVPGTDIDYPVMFTPESPQWYIDKDFYEEFSPSGVPFLDGRTDETCANRIIYGHHMKDGTMFADLCDFLDPTFFDEHPSFFFHTQDGIRTITIFASALITYDDPWYDFLTADGEVLFDQAVNALIGKASAVADSRPSFGDKIITLSTCYRMTDGSRVVVCGYTAQDLS